MTPRSKIAANSKPTAPSVIIAIEASITSSKYSNNLFINLI